MRSCPVPNRYWRRLVNKLGNEDIAYNLYFSKGDSVYDMSDEELSRYTVTPKVETQYQIPAESTEGKIVSEKTIRDLAARMADRIGLNYKIISDRTQVFKGKLEGSTAVVNLAYATLDTPIHEILGHPIIRAIKNRSSILYQNLLKELEYGVGKEILDRVKKDYEIKDVVNKRLAYPEDSPFPYVNQYGVNLEDYINRLISNGHSLEHIVNHVEKNYPYADGEWMHFNMPEWSPEFFGDELPVSKTTLQEVLYIIQGEELRTPDVKYYTLEEQQEEALVELLGLMTADRLDAVSDGKLISLLKRLLKEIKAFIKELLGQREIEIDELPDNITLGDIADILAYSNSKLILPGNEVIYTTPDNQQFKTYQEASNHISQLAKSVEDVDLDNIKINPNLEKEIREKREKLDSELLNIQNKISEATNEINNFEKEIKDSFGDTPRMFTKEELNFFKELKEKLNLNFLYQEENRVHKLINEIRLEEGMFGSSGNTILNFIQKNKEYEQSKEIIEEWKKVNNIQYNPEEVYSRGQEFSSIVGAYSNFDVNLMMQNLLQHIEDNEKAGGEFTISAFTKPIDRQIGHLEGGGGKIKFKIYPQSKDIKWAASIDVFSGSVWDASEKVNKDKQSELLGVSYSKYPPLENVNKIQPNLASVIDNIAHYHNELGISLTGNNFRLEYDEDIPYSTKKIIDSVNSILDQKYGKLVKPEIKSNKFNKGFLNNIINRGYVKNDEKQNLKENYNIDILDSETSFKHIEKIKNVLNQDVITIQPTQTNETLIQSIDDIRDKYSSNTRLTENAITDIKKIPLEFESETADGSFAIIRFEDNTWKAIRENGDMKNLSDWQVLRAYNKSIGQTYKKEFTSQATINTKIAKLKEVAKKYPRSLIRSEVIKKRIVRKNEVYPGEFSGFEEDELPFQKVPSMQPGSYSRYRPSSTISILKQVKFRESIKPGDVTSFTYWSETTSKLVSEKDIVVESVSNDYFEGRYPNGESRTFKYKNIVDDSIQGTLTTFEQKQFKDRLVLGQTIIVKTNIGDFNGQVTSIEEDTFSVDNQQINYSDVFKEEPQLAFLQRIQDLKETISNQIVIYQAKMKTVDQKNRVESLRRALEILEGYKEYNDLIGFFAEVRNNIDSTHAMLKSIEENKDKYTPEKILYIISYAKDFLDSYFHIPNLNNSIQKFEGSEELKKISADLVAQLDNAKKEYFNVALPNVRDVLWEQFDMKVNDQLAADGKKIFTKERLLEELINPSRDIDALNKYFVAPVNSNDIILGLFSKVLKKGKEAARRLNELLLRELTPMIKTLRSKYDLKELMKNFYTITEETVFEDGKPKIIRVRRFIQKYNQKKYYDETGAMYQERQRIYDEINLAEAVGDATAREIAFGKLKIINEKLNNYKKLNGIQQTASQYKLKMDKLKKKYLDFNDDSFIKSLDRYYMQITEEEADENSVTTENEVTGEVSYYKYTNKRWEANKEMFITDEYRNLQTLFNRDPDVERFFTYLTDKYEEANKKIPETYRLRGIVPSVYETSFLNSIKKSWKNFWKTTEKQVMVRMDGKAYKEIPVGFTKLIDIDESSDDILRSTMLFISEANNYAEMNNYIGTADALIEVMSDPSAAPLDENQKQKIKSAMNNRLDALKKNIDQTLYGIHKDSYGIGSKILDLLNKFTSFTRIALKPLNWLSNILVGNMANLSEAVGGRHYGVKDILWAEKEFFKLLFTNPKKLANMIRSLDAIQGRFIKEFGDEFISFKDKYLKWDTMFIGQDMGEVQIQGVAMLAYLRARKIQIPEDGNFDMDTIPSDFVNTLHAINKHNHGVYNDFDRLYLQSNALFRLMLQFRKYIVPTYRSRYDGLFSGDSRVDWESGTVEKGWYRLWWDYHVNTIKNWKEMPSFIASFNSLNDMQKEGVRRTYFDAGIYTLLYALVLMMTPDDEDEEEEMTKVEWNILYQIIKLKGDYGMYLPITGGEDKLRILSNPFAAAPVIGDSLAILSQVTNVTPDKQGNVSVFQEYQRDTGQYKKGDLKILGKISKINGFDNYTQALDPEAALQGYLAASRR